MAVAASRSAPRGGKSGPPPRSSPALPSNALSASSLTWDSLTLTSKPFEAVDTLKDLATTRVEPVLASLPAELRTAHPRITLKALNLGSDPATRNDNNRVAPAVRNSGHTLVSSLSGFIECSIDHRQRDLANIGGRFHLVPSAPRTPGPVSMADYESHRTITTTWLTPPGIIDALGPFDLDPCGHPGWPTADRLICLPDDGLAADWPASDRVWLNPPYGPCGQ